MNMILHRGLILNRFGDKKKTAGTIQLTEFAKETQLKVRLLKLQNDFNTSAKQTFTKIKDHAKKTERIFKSYYN